MRLVILGSGSRGNAVVVESATGRLLLDAGFSCRQLERRMAAVGIEASSIDALVLTHEHGDHVKGVDVFVRRHRVPVWATGGTLDHLRLSDEARGFTRTLAAGWPTEVAGFQVEAFPIPHDAAEPVGLVVEDGGGRRLGLAADLGFCSRLAWGRLADLDALLLETNHDLGLLRDGPYPWVVKQRVAGRHGHLSNREASEGLPELLGDRLRWIALYHLSQTNNSPELAVDAVGEVLDAEGSAARLVVAGQDAPTPWMELHRPLEVAE